MYPDQPVGAHGRPGGDALGHEVAERVGGGVVDDLHADAPGAGAADLNGHDDQCLDALLAATPEPRLVAADEALVDLDSPGERLPLGIDHGATQLVEHRPRRLVPLQPELALQLQGRDPRRRRGHQVGGPEPQMQRRTGSVKHRARGHRDLIPAGRALPQQPPRQAGCRLARATWAPESLRPPRLKQVLPARVLIGKAALELDDRAREVRSSHA